MKLIKFTSDNCPPCKLFATIWDQIIKISEQTHTPLEFQVINTDKEENMGIVWEYWIRSVPCLFFENHKGKHKYTGDMMQVWSIIQRLRNLL